MDLSTVIDSHYAHELLPARWAAFLKARDNVRFVSARSAYLLVAAGNERVGGGLAHTNDARSQALSMHFGVDCRAIGRDRITGEANILTFETRLHAV